MAGTIYDLAAVRTQFPFDFGNLMIFHPGYEGASKDDPLDMTLQRAGRELGIGEAVNALVSEVERIWRAFIRRHRWSSPTGIGPRKGVTRTFSCDQRQLPRFTEGVIELS